MAADNKQQQFFQTYGSVAKQVGDKIGVDPALLLAQWGLETGYGKSIIPGTNNLGNIKDFSGKGVKAKDNMTGSNDGYKVFSSPEDFGTYYAGMIQRKYPGAVGSGSNVNKFATELKKGGYAEDPGYVGKIISIAEKILGMVVPSAQAAEDPFDKEFSSWKAAKTKAAEDPFDKEFSSWKAAKTKAAPQQQEPDWFEPGSKSEALTRGFSQAATFGFGDEISAGVNAGIDKLTGSDKPISELYANRRDTERQANADAAATNPISYGAGNIVGGAPAFLASAPKSVAGAAIKSGAISGITGLGSGVDGDRLQNAAKNAAIGSLAGGVAAKVLPGVMPGIQAGATGAKTAILDELSDWSGKSLLGKGIDYLRGGIQPTLQDTVKPAIHAAAHAVAPGLGAAVPATYAAGKGMVEGLKTGSAAALKAINNGAPSGGIGWATLMSALTKYNGGDRAKAAQEIFKLNQTSSEARTTLSTNEKSE